MRKIFPLLLIYIFISFSSRAQYVTIPDANLKASLMQQFPTCFNGSGLMDTSCSNIVNDLVLHLESISIANWDGIQYFDNLRELYIGGQITSIPYISPSLRSFFLINGSVGFTTLSALPNWLTNISISNCGWLTGLPAWPTSLTRLEVKECVRLTSVPTFPNSIRYLDCNSNKLLNLPNLPSSLDTLICYSNDSISVLPALPNNLEYLDCSSNRITSLGTSLPATLKFLNCNYNQVTQLPSLPNGLQRLHAVVNQLTAVPAFPPGLTDISLGGNNISSLPGLPASLQTLDVESNQLTSLPSLPNTIFYLYCGSNQLTSLPVLPTSLLRLYCYYNLLTSLPQLTNTAITELQCRGNQLTSLPVLPSTLAFLGCESNQLTALPVLPAGIYSLRCNDNELTYLPDLPIAISEVKCQNNFIRCLPVLPNIIYLDIDNRIGCMPNNPSTYSVYVHDTATGVITTFYGSGQNLFPLCSVINNVSHCAAFPVMTGHVYNDNNNNNIKDADEPYRINTTITLSNGNFITTDYTGYYQFVTDTIGPFTITCTPPNYYAAVPPSYSYNFNSYDSLIVNDFALQASTSVPSVNLTITPLVQFARPGFPLPLDISYENTGTTTLIPNIVFNYSNTELTYDSSSNPAVVNTGSSLVLNDTAMVAGEWRHFIAYFRVNATLPLGDSIYVNAIISSVGTIATDTALAGVRGSCDPNDKAATPAMSPQQVADGNYIRYTIRFQNTGTDTAFNVVIMDTLSNLLQPGTLQVITSSHPCKTTVKGNTISFEFLNILLPDSNVNELKSHGFITFKLKPQPTVALDSVISNSAAIYFDYNLPVITNTAVTQIMNPPPPASAPLQLLSFTVQAISKNTARVDWATSNENNLHDFFVEYSTDGNNYRTGATEPPKGNQFNSYTKEVAIPLAKKVYYRLKITDASGQFFYGPVVSLQIINSAPGFTILDNPVKQVLNISIDDPSLKNSAARIINAQGAVIQQLIIKNEIETINIANLPAGTYIFETIIGSKRFVVLN